MRLHGFRRRLRGLRVSALPCWRSAACRSSRRPQSRRPVRRAPAAAAPRDGRSKSSSSARRGSAAQPGEDVSAAGRAAGATRHPADLRQHDRRGARRREARVLRRGDAVRRSDDDHAGAGEGPARFRRRRPRARRDALGLVGVPESDKYISLIGGQLQRHGTGEFTAEIVQPSHPIMQGLKPFLTWDETLVHTKHNAAAGRS